MRARQWSGSWTGSVKRNRLTHITWFRCDFKWGKRKGGKGGRGYFIFFTAPNCNRLHFSNAEMPETRKTWCTRSGIQSAVQVCKYPDGWKMLKKNFRELSLRVNRARRMFFWENSCCPVNHFSNKGPPCGDCVVARRMQIIIYFLNKSSTAVITDNKESIWFLLERPRHAVMSFPRTACSLCLNRVMKSPREDLLKRTS